VPAARQVGLGDPTGGAIDLSLTFGITHRRRGIRLDSEGQTVRRCSMSGEEIDVSGRAVPRCLMSSYLWFDYTASAASTASGSITAKESALPPKQLKDRRLWQRVMIAIT